VNHIEVNYQKRTVDEPLPAVLPTESTATYTVTLAYTNGTAYDVSVVTSSGQEFTDHFTGGQNVS
jgi:hypothetical protein